MGSINIELSSLHSLRLSKQCIAVNKSRQHLKIFGKAKNQTWGGKVRSATATAGLGPPPIHKLELTFDVTVPLAVAIIVLTS